MDYPVGQPGGLARSFDPPVIEPPAGRNLAAVVKPELLCQACVDWLTVIDQRDLSGDRNPWAILLPNFGEYLVTQCAPHRTNVVKIRQLHAAQVSNLTNKFYKRSQREIFAQEIAARHSRNHIWRLYRRIGVSACRRGKAAFAREESSRKCAKFNVSTAEIPEKKLLDRNGG